MRSRTDNDPLHVEYGFNKIFRTILLLEEYGFKRQVTACEMGLMSCKSYPGA